MKPFLLKLLVTLALTVGVCTIVQVGGCSFQYQFKVGDSVYQGGFGGGKAQIQPAPDVLSPSGRLQS